MTIRYATLCSGIEAVSVAIDWLGLQDEFELQFVSEIEPFPNAVLAHHYPGVPNYGDLTKWEDWPVTNDLDLVCAGTPCQSFSVAGHRRGFDDHRGDLTLTFIDYLESARPRWFIWENVPGVLSMDGGRTFGAILWEMAQLGYGLAWRILDAQHLGVPQRRRRLFIVGYLGDARRASAVLFEPGISRGDSSAGQETRTRTSAFAANGAGADGQAYDVANTLTARMSKGINTTLDEGQTPVIVMDTTQITNPNNRSNPKPGGPCHTLPNDGHPPAVAFNWQNGGGYGNAEDGLGVSVEQSPPLSRSQTPAVAVQGVRRLTPRECERLQGFNDDYTAIPWRNKAAEDCPLGHRYRALGNSMAVPVMAWILARLRAVEALT